VSDTARIMIVDDEVYMRLLLCELLSRHGYDVSAAAGGEEALAMLQKGMYDLILLDLVMPGMDGLQVMREVGRLAPDTVIIMLTAYASLDSAIETIRHGGHDYLTKPCSTNEILSSVKEGLEKRRRLVRQHDVIRQMSDLARQLAGGEGQPTQTEQPRGEQPRYLHVGGLLLDRGRQRVNSSGQSIPLTPSEYRLLLCLMEHPGTIVSFGQLAEAVHGAASDEAAARDAISTHMWRLRRKLDAADPSQARIASVRGQGYVLSTPQASDARPD
jgi:DNA-binding response OmpR family regulator